MPDQPTGPPHSNPSWQFLAALPDLARIDEELALALQPAMTQGRDQDRGFARAAWMLSKALRFLLEAAQSGDPSGFDAALAEVDTSALAAAWHARGIRAAAATVEELAAAGEVSRSAGLDLGECAAAGAAVRILWPDPSEGLAPDELEVDLDPPGRARWRSGRHGQLPVDGRAQLDLAAALDSLAAAYAQTVPGTGQADPEPA